MWCDVEGYDGFSPKFQSANRWSNGVCCSTAHGTRTNLVKFLKFNCFSIIKLTSEKIVRNFEWNLSNCSDCTRNNKIEWICLFRVALVNCFRLDCFGQKSANLEWKLATFVTCFSFCASFPCLPVGFECFDQVFSQKFSRCLTVSVVFHVSAILVKIRKHFQSQHTGTAFQHFSQTVEVSGVKVGNWKNKNPEKYANEEHVHHRDLYGVSGPLTVSFEFWTKFGRNKNVST